MKARVLLIFAALLCFAGLTAAQDLPQGTQASLAGYVLGPGDEITVKVFGEPQFDFVAVVDDNGRIRVPFVKEAVVVKCQTEGDLSNEITKKFSTYLRDPQISVRVTDRKSRPPVSVYGEVRAPAQVILQRKVTLRELIAFVGGVSEKSNGMIQLTRTRPDPCSEQAESDWKNQIAEGGAPTRSYSLTSIEKGGESSNPEIYPGDIVVVAKAAPIYVIGQVMALKEITMSENGLSLTEALAQAGGFGPRAKTQDIKIRRLKSNSREREVIAVNYKLIKTGAQKDIMLQPEDIVEVDKAPKSVAETVLELVTGTARSFTNVLPQRVMY